MDLVPGRRASTFHMPDEPREFRERISCEQHMDVGADGPDRQDPRTISRRDRPQVSAEESRAGRIQQRLAHSSGPDQVKIEAVPHRTNISIALRSTVTVFPHTYLVLPRNRGA